MNTCQVVLWMALRLWPLAGCCDQLAATEPPKEEQPAACASDNENDKALLLQGRILRLEGRIMALEAKIAMLEQAHRVQHPPSIYIPPPSMPMPPSMPIAPPPSYPGWGIQPVPMSMPGPLPHGWQMREFNGQQYYMVPVNGMQ